MERNFITFCYEVGTNTSRSKYSGEIQKIPLTNDSVNIKPNEITIANFSDLLLIFGKII